jgi:leucyl/phenylalanyl-tRNA---protein transferase
VSGEHRTAGEPAELARDMIGGYVTGWFPVDKNPDGPILWNTVEQRAIIQPTEEGIARVRRARKADRWEYQVRLDGDFDVVLRACAVPRGNDVWLTSRLCGAYRILRDMGFCRCCTAYDPAGQVAGGVLLVTIARVSFLETMFHWSSDAGNAALLGTLELLLAEGCRLIDLQYLASDHIRRFGAIEIPRQRYLELLREALEPPEPRAVHVPRRLRNRSAYVSR